MDGPERSQLPHGVEKRLEVDGLHDEGVDAEAVAPDDVRLLSAMR